MGTYTRWDTLYLVRIYYFGKVLNINFKNLIQVLIFQYCFENLSRNYSLSQIINNNFKKNLNIFY